MEHERNQTISITEREGQPWLLLQGVVDIFSAEELYRAALCLLERGESTVVCCEGASYLDTSAVQILLALEEGLREKGKSLHMVGVPAVVASHLRLAGLDGVFLQEDN